MCILPARCSLYAVMEFTRAPQIPFPGKMLSVRCQGIYAGTANTFKFTHWLNWKPPYEVVFEGSPFPPLASLSVESPFVLIWNRLRRKKAFLQPANLNKLIYTGVPRTILYNKYESPV